MSHLRERKDKNCLNCGTQVHGRYCHVCGQENIEPKESFWHLVTHFFNDITHFDGKFFHSLKYVLFKPGVLATEYLKGRRASYLNPIRMYVFTSAVFFIFFFSFSPKNIAKVNFTVQEFNDKSRAEIEAMDSASFAAFTAYINRVGDKPGPPMSRKEFQHFADSLVRGVHFTSHRYKSKKEYDSLLAAGVKKHNWIQRQFIYKEIAMNEKYENDAKQIITAFQSNFLHNLPKVLFISLPLLALLLQLLYVRRKQFYYVNHAIFSIYLYIFLFLVFLVMIGIARLSDQLEWGIFQYILLLLGLSIFVYQYLAMYNFYKQGIFKTFFKFLLLNILYMITIGIIFLFFIIFSLFEI